MFSRNVKPERFEEVWRSNPLQIAFCSVIVHFGGVLLLIPLKWAPHAWQPGGAYWVVRSTRGAQPEWAFELAASDRWLWWMQMISLAGMIASVIVLAACLAVSLIVASVRGKTPVHHAGKRRRAVILSLVVLFVGCVIFGMGGSIVRNAGRNNAVSSDAILVPHDSTLFSF